MKNIFLIAICLILSPAMFSQSSYTFLGNGNWTTASNWSNNVIPPSMLPAGSTINIRCANGDSCVLDILQTISAGAFFYVAVGANLILKNNLFISGSALLPDGVFVDSRDGQPYTFQQIGTQVWMTKNLNFDTVGSHCYNNSSTNCETYGRLYNWTTALVVAPAGWHLPSDEEWTTLVTFLGGEGSAGPSMKSVTGWNAPNTGATNSSGFSGLPGGLYDPPGFFEFIGTNGMWWSSTQFDTMYAWTRSLNYYFANDYRNSRDKMTGLSVRCIRN
jgi:uncharacterized protein (TIGR02145 family)